MCERSYVGAKTVKCVKKQSRDEIEYSNSKSTARVGRKTLQHRPRRREVATLVRLGQGLYGGRVRVNIAGQWTGYVHCPCSATESERTSYSSTTYLSPKVPLAGTCALVYMYGSTMVEGTNNSERGGGIVNVCHVWSPPSLTYLLLTSFHMPARGGLTDDDGDDDDGACLPDGDECCFYAFITYFRSTVLRE